MKLEYWEEPANRWYFHIRSRNGRIMVESQGYNSKQALLKTAERLRRQAGAMPIEETKFKPAQL